MKRTLAWHTTMNAVCLLASLSHVHAAPFDPKSVAADAKWVVHLDMDATQKGKAWDMLVNRIKKDHPDDDFQNKLDGLNALLGVRFPQDIHSVTMFGRTFGDEPSAVIIHATMDQEKITTVLKANEAYKKISYGDHDIHSWFDKDKNRTMFGSFSGTSVAVLSDSVEQVQMALDVIDGKSKGLSMENALAQGKGTTVLLYVAGDGMGDMPKEHRPESPVLGQLTSAWLTISEDDEQLVMRASLSAKTEQAAAQIQAMAQGFKSMFLLSMAGDPNDSKSKFMTDVMQSLAFRTDGKQLTVEWPVALEKVSVFLDAMPKGLHP